MRKVKENRIENRILEKRVRGGKSQLFIKFLLCELFPEPFLP